MTFNVANSETLALLLSRRSIKARDMVPPGPDPDTLDKILRAGLRVPDHGKLAPWRFFVFEGRAREDFGGAMAAAYSRETGQTRGPTLKGLRRFPMQAPVMVAVASVVSDAKPIPEWEQVLSAGAACMNMLVAAHALGFVGQWLTGWAAYSDEVRRALGLDENGRIAGFLFFGSQAEQPSERPRAEFDAVVTRWSS